MKILIDADAIFALIVKADANHNKAKQLLHANGDNEFILPGTTFAEVITTFGRKIDKKLSLAVIDYVYENKFEVESVDAATILLAENYYRNQNSKKNTFFDCINMAIAKSYAADYIFSFDHGYEQNGFKLLK